MNLRGFQIKTAMIIFITVLALGLGLQYLHQAIQVLIPLTKELQELPGVERVHLSKGSWPNRSRIMVELTLDAKVPLASSLGQVRQILSSLGGAYAIELEDSATGELVELFQKIQIAAEEAIMTGQFTLLEERVETLAFGRGLQWELAVDRDFVYLRLSDTANALQRVIARDEDGGRVTISTKGVGANGQVG